MGGVRMKCSVDKSNKRIKTVPKTELLSQYQNLTIHIMNTSDGAREENDQEND